MSTEKLPPVDKFLKRLNISPGDVETTFPALYQNLNPVLTALRELRTLREEIKEKEGLIHQLQSQPVTPIEKSKIPSIPEPMLIKWRAYFHRLQDEYNGREFKNQNWIDVRLDFVRCFIAKDNIWMDKHDLREFFSYTEDAILIKLKKYHGEGWVNRSIPEKYHEAYRYQLNFNKTNFQVDL